MAASGQYLVEPKSMTGKFNHEGENGPPGQKGAQKRKINRAVKQHRGGIFLGAVIFMLRP
jgi:hypothetical protein